MEFARLITTKILLYSVVPTILALCMCADIHYLYYNIPMVDFEYMKLPLSMFAQEIIDQYNLKYPVAVDGFIYTEIRKGIPGIKQARRQASNQLTKNLARNGDAPVPHTVSHTCLQYLSCTFQRGPSWGWHQGGFSSFMLYLMSIVAVFDILGFFSFTRCIQNTLDICSCYLLSCFQFV